jgi:uncharacterized repeat protein (TIGR03837 family)
MPARGGPDRRVSGSAATPERWDLFCRVVDNFGDIGIAWRLARQLARSGEREIHLVVDRLDVFARIEARIDPARDLQIVDGITVIAWSSVEDAARDIAAVVVEVLGCGLPAGYVDAMVRAARAAVWIDFEHLSAEAWVREFHGLPSPHPTLPLTKHFFYPGFDDATGGLLVEPGIARDRRVFLDSPAAIAALWQRLDVPALREGETRIALFAYPDAPFAALIDALSQASGAWSVLVPEGLPIPARGSVTVHAIPFVDQDTFDRLLWACDANFVRGEDSFVRAQIAGRPFVWQVYRQSDAVHLTKLRAFETLYEAGLPATAAAAQRRLWTAWNERHDDMPEAVRDWVSQLPALRVHAAAWRQRLVEQSPLVDRLLAFVASRKSIPRGPHGLLD